MTDPSRYRGSERETGIPRWVKVLGIIAAVVALLMVAMMLLLNDGGGHGPARHGLSGGDGVQPPPFSVVRDHTSPAGAHG